MATKGSDYYFFFVNIFFSVIVVAVTAIAIEKKTVRECGIVNALTTTDSAPLESEKPETVANPLSLSQAKPNKKVA